MSTAVVVSGLRKTYGDVAAVAGIDFEIARGEVFGLLGPNGAGKTILLTTHYLEEAEQLADRVAVINAGRIVGAGTPSELTAARSTEIRYRENGRELVIETDRPTKLLHDLTAEALAAGREIEGLEVRRPTLEDVYLSLTGGTEE